MFLQVLGHSLLIKVRIRYRIATSEIPGAWELFQS